MDSHDRTRPARTSAEARPHRGRGRTRRAVRRTVAAGVAIATAVGGLGGALPAAAQSQPVLVTVRSAPPRPEPGDDVTITASIEGCPVGPVTAEAYLETSNGTEREAVLVTRTAAVTDVLLRTVATLELPDAVEGWYGVRVLCGSYRPPRRSLANTLTHVRPTEPSTFDVEGDVVSLSTPPTLAGTGCFNGVVQYMYQNGFAAPTRFEEHGTIAPSTAGVWRGQAPVPEGIFPGPVMVRARCVVGADTATPRTFYYPIVRDLTAVR